jgi:hypothetical protein
MIGLVMIFVLAFVACALVHLINRGTAQMRADARAISGTILTGAWVLALARAWSLAQFVQ